MPEKKANQVKKKTNNINYKLIVVVLCTCAFVIYLIISIYVLFKKPTDVFVVEEGALSQEEMSDAYIIRNETVLQGENYKNGMAKIKLEGERVQVRRSCFPLLY